MLKRSKAKPFFGHFPKNTISGSTSRMRRLIHEFGNHRIFSNILYANSSEIIPLRKIQTTKSKSSRVKIVYNQNGLYYPAWYPSDDWRTKNQRMKMYFEHADWVIFQSLFCKKAFLELCQVSTTELQTKKNIVLCNTLPDLLDDNADAYFHKKDYKNPIVSLSGQFQNDSEHILRPALHAFKILKERLGKDAPQLRIIGPWNANLIEPTLIKDLKQSSTLHFYPSYLPHELPQIYQDISLALHLKYKDPCPNAVVERMCLGLAHVYSDSGGTPELIQNSGLSIPVSESWDQLIAVNSDLLANKILQGLENAKSLGQSARTRYLKDLSWSHYIGEHKRIFEEVLC